MTPRDGEIGRSERVYAALLRLFPAEFRTQFEHGMRYAFERDIQKARAAGTAAVASFWARTLLDVIGSGIRERLVTTPRFVERFIRDSLYAARRIRKHPGFSAATILTLGAGIGATTAIFSVVHGVLLKPLPYPDADELVDVGHVAASGGSTMNIGLTDASYFVYGEDGRLTDGLSAYFEYPVNLTGSDRTERIQAVQATPGLAATLGVPPVYGRWFTDEEDVRGGANVAVISHGLWLRLFGGLESPVGQTVSLNGVETSVIGVMPAGFQFPDVDVDVWAPIRFDESSARSVNFQYPAVARLQNGATAADAQVELDNLFPRTVERFPAGLSTDELRDLGIRAEVVPLKNAIVGDVATVLWPVMAAVFVILLVACANVANLFLIQAEGRDREIGVRLALGAGRRDVARHFLVESGVLGLCGGLLGVTLAYGGVALLRAVGPSELPRLYEVAVTLPVLGFAAVVSLSVGLLFGAFPALRTRAASALAGLRSGTRGSSAGPRRHHARNVLVTSQLALALVLLAGAGLMLRTFDNLLGVEPGFVPDNLLTFELAVPFAEAPGQLEGMEFQQLVIDRIEELPGVVSATASPSGLPIQRESSKNPVWLEDFPSPPGELPPTQSVRIIMPGYFETLGIPIKSGRALERRDLENATGAVVVSEGFAERYWPGESPIGKRMQVVPETDFYTIVGVAGNTHGDGLEQPVNHTVYWGVLGPGELFYTDSHVMTYAVSTRGEPASVVGAVREAIEELSGGVAMGAVSTMDEWVDRSVARISFTMTLLGIAAAMSLLLGSLGVYGVLAYAVSQRRREIGVRIALGASPRTVSRLVLRDAITVIGAGLFIGLAGAFAVTRLLESLLFGVQAVDFATYAAVSGLLAVVALTASYLPARRAAAVDPALTLRSE